MPDRETLVLPEAPSQNYRKVAAKTGTGGAIGGVAVLVGTIASGAIAANNPDRIDPMMQKTIAGVITAAVAAVLGGVLNWFKHR